MTGGALPFTISTFTLLALAGTVEAQEPDTSPEALPAPSVTITDPSTGAPQYPPQQPPAPANGVYVELNADDPNTRIDRMDGGTPVPVCLAPCRMVLDRNQLYVIQGQGVRRTSQFLLPDGHDRVTLDVEAGSSSRMATGVVLTVGGGAMAYLGMFVIQMTAFSHLANASDPEPRRASSLSPNVGLAMMGGGITAAAIGIYLAATARTSVTSSTGSRFSDASPQARKRSKTFALTARGIEF